MACFNKHNVKSFYDNLTTVMEEKQFNPDRIYNFDETGVMTVQRPSKQIAETGAKRVGSVVSQERGVLVTVCCSVNAIGNSLPLFCVFPRVCAVEAWEDNLPIGSVGKGHPKASGWITSENFLSFLKHFSKYSRPTEDNPVLLLLDNHAFLIRIEAIDFCKSNHITLLSLPPHCSHELQPLDKSVYGSFKTFF